LITQYEAVLNQVGQEDFFKKTVEDLFNENPFEEAVPPFAMGQRPSGK
jgi:hypothetical protein